MEYHGIKVELNQVWTTRFGRLALIVNNFCSSESDADPYCFLWYDAHDKDFSATLFLDRLTRLTDRTPADFFRQAM